MTVRVANDFKTEAHNAREQLALDNKALRERIRAMEQQIEKLNKRKYLHVNVAIQSIWNAVESFGFIMACILVVFSERKCR